MPKRLLLILAFVLMVAACGGNEGAAPDATAVVPAGSTLVTSEDGRVRVIVPEGATEAAADISISRVEEADAPEMFAPELVGSVYELLPAGTQFSAPALVEIRIPRSTFGDLPDVPLLVSALVSGGEIEVPSTQAVRIEGEDVLHVSSISHFSRVAIYHGRLSIGLEPQQSISDVDETFHVSRAFRNREGIITDSSDEEVFRTIWLADGPVVEAIADGGRDNHKCLTEGTATIKATVEVGNYMWRNDNVLSRQFLSFLVFMGAPGAVNAGIDYKLTLDASATCGAATSGGSDTTAGAAAPLCEDFNSSINVGSIGEVGRAAEGTGLIPDDVGSRTVGLELRRMMEVTGEVCQADLLALTESGALTPELEAAIKLAVERVREAG